uniref:Uncharacterized protein n=1 Tax=Timema douglasi TaxID=61478 RepID=A0A7R8VV16_TIMDO|nr:unnamed protein product [Timema douglasi]
MRPEHTLTCSKSPDTRGRTIPRVGRVRPVEHTELTHINLLLFFPVGAAWYWRQEMNLGPRFSPLYGCSYQNLTINALVSIQHDLIPLTGVAQSEKLTSALLNAHLSMFSSSSQSKVEHLLVENMVWSVQILVAMLAGIQFLGCQCVDMLSPQLEEKRNGTGQLAIPPSKNSDEADSTRLTLTPVPSQDPIQDEAAALTSKQVMKRGDFMHIDTTSNVLVDQSCSLGPRQAISPAPRTSFAPLVTKQETELERSERINRGFQRAIQFVNILGQVDSYLSGRARAAVHALSRVYDDIDSRSHSGRN